MMRKYFSQNGEDFLLWSAFRPGFSTGFFVEVGALDGIRFSNTYSFELEGWSGICIEPHPDYFPLLRKNRPKSRCVEVAAGNREGQVEFYAEPRGDFSTMIQSNIKDEKVMNKVVGFKKICIPVLRLNNILKEADAPTSIDVVSIDVEGAEVDVLEGFDISYYKPRVLVIEANGSVANKKTDDYMKAKGYFKAGRLERTNNFYCRSRLDALRISCAILTCDLIQPPHPMYAREGEDKDWQIKHLKRPSLTVVAWKQFFYRVYSKFSDLFSR